MIEAFKLLGKIALEGANKVKSDLENLETKVKTSSEKFRSFGDKIKQAGTAAGNAGAKFKISAEKAEAFGNSMKTAGEGASKWLSVPLAALGVGALKAASDLSASQATIQQELGVSGKEAEKLNGVAKKLWAQGFGENIQGVAEKVAGVTKSLGALGKTDLSYVTKGLDLFERRGWADTQESLRAVKTLMEQFGMSATEATDYLAAGFQQNLNYSGEFLDTISEYGTYFSEMGFSGNEFFATLKSGAESGAFQLDKVGDAMKEFTLRSKDGSKASTEAFSALGLNATEMTNAFNVGGETGRAAFQKVVTALQNTESETERNKIAVALFGTQYEDLGEKAFTAFLDASNGLQNVEGAAGKANAAFQQTFGVRLQSAIRQVQVALEPVGQVLMDFVQRILPPLLEKIQGVAKWFGDLSPVMQNVTVIVGALAAAFGPILVVVGNMVGAVVKLLPVLTKAKTGFTVVRTALMALTGPIGATIAVITLLVAGGVKLYQNWDTIKNHPLVKGTVFGTLMIGLEKLAGLFKSSIPPVDNFGSSVSNTTKKSVQSLLDLSTKGTEQLTLFVGQSKTISQDMATSLSGTYNQMADKVIAALQKQKTKGIQEQTAFFNESGALTDAREAEILQKRTAHYDQQIAKTQAGNTRINEIIQTAANEHRAISSAESAEITRIKNEMVETGIQAMSKNELESKTILTRMKQNSDEMNAQMAANVVKESIKSRDGAIKSANETYDQKIAKIIQMRDETGEITKQEADLLLNEATREKDGAIAKAQEMHTGVITEAKAQAGEHVNEVDWSTGEIKTKWQSMKTDLVEKTKTMGTDIKTSWNSWVDETNTKLENGTSNMKTKWDNFYTNMTTKTQQLSTDMGTKWTNLKTNLETKTEEMKSNVETKWENFKTNLSSKTGTLKSDLETKWTDLKNKTNTTFENLKSSAGTTWGNLKTDLTTKSEGIRSTVSTKFTETKTKAESLFNTAKTNLGTTWGNLKSDITTKSGGIASTVSTKFTEAKNSMMNPINTAKEKVLGYIETIKSKFNGLKLTIPKPKVPTIKIKWSTKEFLGKSVTYPTGFDVGWAGWNAKGGIVDGPTILGAGEAGKEALLPLEGKYFKPVAQMIAENMAALSPMSAAGAGSIEIPVILNGREIARAVVSDLDREMERHRAIRRRGI